MTITVILFPKREKIDPIAIKTGRKYFPIRLIIAAPKVSIVTSLTGIS